MQSITLKAPAKINLCLSVLGRRPDGYHDVEMLMQMVGLYDEVTVAARRHRRAVQLRQRCDPVGRGQYRLEGRPRPAEAGRLGEPGFP